MNLQEILDEVRAWPMPWELDEFGRIRSGCDCPLTIGTAFKSCDVDDAVVLMGIDGNMADQVILAADANGACHPALRRQLLEACGLTEGKP